MIYGERVRQARELRGLTQKALAVVVQLHQSAVAHLEADRATISESALDRIALATGFPTSFFRQRPDSDFSPGSLRFRAHAAATSLGRTQAYRYAQTIFEGANKLATLVNLVPLTLGRMEASPSEAARKTRQTLGLSDNEPINHLMDVIERAGVIVLAIPMAVPRLDAFSAWVGNPKRPVVALLTDKPTDRFRLTLAHELGHLLIHDAAEGNRIEIEREANAFAGEFLVPAKGLRRELRPPITLVSFADLKRRWGVSIQALVRRARDLSLISANQYRYLCQQIGAKGWRKNEPVDLRAESEKPRAVRKIIELVYGVPIDADRVAADLHLQPIFVDEIIKSYASSFERGQTIANVPRRVFGAKPRAKG